MHVGLTPSGLRQHAVVLSVHCLADNLVHGSEALGESTGPHMA